MVFPLVTPPFFYATEARSYGLLLGFSALAGASWLHLGTNRPKALLGLAASLLGASSCHYYGILLVAPLAAAEVFRSFERRKWDSAVWAAFCAAALPLLCFLPLIRQARTYADGFWSKPTLADLVKFPEPFIGQVAGPLLALLACAAVWRATQTRFAQLTNREAAAEPNRLHLPALLTAFLLTPVLSWLLGKWITGVYTIRYTPEPLIAFSGLFAIGVARLTHRSKTAALITLAVLVVYANISFARAASKWPAETASIAIIPTLAATPDYAGLPVVISSIEMWLRMNYYDSACARARCLYLDDPSASLKYSGENTNEREIIGFRPIMPASLYSYRDWTAAHDKFLVFTVTDRPMWILPQLLADGWTTQIVAAHATGLLLYVTRPAGQPHTGQ